MNREKIQARLRDLISEGDGIYKAAETEERKLTEDETKRMAEIEAGVAECEADIKALDKRSGWDSKAEELRRFETPAIIPGDNGKSAVEDRTSYHGWPEEHAADFFRCVIAHKQNRGVPNDIHAELRNTFMESRVTGQGTLIAADGGFLVPSTVATTILRKVFSDGQIISRTQPVPITVGDTAEWNAVQENSRASGSRYGGVTVGRFGEGVGPTASTAATERVKLELKSLGALVYLTNKQIEDGPQMLTLINDLVPAAIRFANEDEIINGDGASQMQGILNANATVSVAKESGQAAATILYENIVNMYSRMFAPSRPNSVWYINQDIEPQLMTMSLSVGTGGVPVYMPANNASGSPFGTLLGRPVVPVEHCKTLGTVGDIILADMGQYLYASKGGIRSAQSMHVKFVEGELALRFEMRNDGKSWWPSALTPANGSNTLSPFVTLATRA